MPGLGARTLAARSVVALSIVAGFAAPSAAQSSLLPRAAFSFEWASLLAADRRFDWQARLAFDTDLFRTARWRGRFQGGYEATLGRERRRYDINHGNYSFDISGGYLVGSTEIIGRATHVSRHLVDRDNPPSISWNTVGARVTHDVVVGQSTIRAELGIDRAMQQAYVDYAWMSDTRLAWRRPIGTRVTAFADGWGGVRVMDGTRSDRPRICGGRIEGGVAIRGRAANVEIFAGYERRMDAYPVDRFRVRMFTIGARIGTK